MSKKATGDVLEEHEDISSLFRSPTPMISILLTGTTASGKSTLVNCILGSGFAKESKSIGNSCTQKVTVYKGKVGKIDVYVWDTPGLQDGTPNQEKYLREMVGKCSHVDITIHCINSCTTRFVPGTGNPDVMSMINFTKVFGFDFWKNAVIVLTFANMLECVHLDWLQMSRQKKAEVFKGVIQEWKELIAERLKRDVGVPSEIVDCIKVIPAGHYLIRDLPDREYWFSTLWFECLDTIPSPEAKGALLKINLDRIKSKRKPIVSPSEPSVGGAVGSVVGGALGFLNRKLLGGSKAAGTDPLFNSKLTTEYLCWF